MRMMRVSECLDHLDGITRGQLYGMINRGIVKSARVGGVLVVDLDTVKRQIETYKPYSASGDLVTKTELCRRTGLSAHQVDRMVRDGCIRPRTNGSSRMVYNIKSVERYLSKLLEGGEDDDNRGDPDEAPGAEARKPRKG